MPPRRAYTITPEEVPSQSSHESQSVAEDSQRRMKQLSSGQMEKIYGKGFRLLQKAGFDPIEASRNPAPIKVTVRRPREGLQDDDYSGRKALGDVLENQRNTEMDTINVSEYTNTFTEIKNFVEAEGGSAPLYRVFMQIVKERVPSATISIFKLVLELKGPKYGFKLSASSGVDIVLVNPPRELNFYMQSIPCICTPPNAQYPVSYNRVVDWAEHVFNCFEFGHEEYEMKLMKISQNREIRLFHCLACKRPFLDLVRLVKHCRAMDDKDHSMFGKIVIGTLLGPNDCVGHDLLFLTALETCDPEFPWKKFSGLATDVFDDIPFEDPSTPIDLSDDSEVVEVMDLEGSEESDLSKYDIHCVINLEE